MSGTKPKVAVLGAGIMGAGVARSLAREGLPPRVWNRTRAKAEALAEAGATVAATPDEAVRGADVVVVVLNDGASVEQVLEEAAPGTHAGQVWLQASTVGVAATAALAGKAAERGLVYLDAPVLGTKQPAETGALTVFVAGPRAAEATVAPVLDAIGRKTVWVGEEAGAATRLKLVANAWVLNLVSAAAESLNLADALGVDPQAFLDAVKGGPIDTPYLHAKAGAVLSGDLSASFAVSTALKDAGLILEAAADHGARLDLVEATAARFARAEELGHGDDDMIATYFAGRRT